MVGKKRPRSGWPIRSPTPSAYLRPSYPLAGCSPAEPASVSPGEKAIPQACRRCKTNQELPVRKAGKSVAKEWPFFVQRIGSTLPQWLEDMRLWFGLELYAVSKTSQET